MRDLTAGLLSEVCSQVATEPDLQPVSEEEFSLSTTNVQNSVRLDIVMNRLWGQVRVCMHLLMLVFLIHLLHQTQPVPHQLAISSMKTRRREHMGKGSKRLSMLHLLLWLCWPLVKWLMRQLIFMIALLSYCLISEGMNICCNGLVEVFFVIFFVTFCYLMYFWGLLLNSTPCCGSSTNAFSEGGVQYAYVHGRWSQEIILL